MKIRPAGNESHADGFSKNTEKLNFMKIRPAGNELFHADGEADKHYSAVSRISQFCEPSFKIACSTLQYIVLHERYCPCSFDLPTM